MIFLKSKIEFSEFTHDSDRNSKNICIYLKTLESDFSAIKKMHEECSSSENTREENVLLSGIKINVDSYGEKV